MFDEKALILVAHSDRRTLLSLYILLDAEGYFVAPCFSSEDLLKYCGQYKPELVMTNLDLPDHQEGRLLEAIQERSPGTRILLLPEDLGQTSRSATLEVAWSRAILRAAEGLPVPDPPIHLNGF